MNSYINHGSYFYITKISFSIPSNFDCYVLKLMVKNLNAYKLTVERNLLMPLLKTFTKKKALL